MSTPRTSRSPVGGDPGGDHDGAGHDLAQRRRRGRGCRWRRGTRTGTRRGPRVRFRNAATRSSSPAQIRRHLGLGDPGVDAHRLHQVIDGAGRDAVDVGLHHHRVQGLIDPATRLEDLREERALAQLRDPHVQVAGLGRQHPATVPVAVRDPLRRSVPSAPRRSPRWLRASISSWSAHGRARGPDRSPSPAVSASSSSDTADSSRAIGVFSLVCTLVGTHRASRRWLTPWWTRPKPHHAKGLIHTLSPSTH